MGYKLDGWHSVAYYCYDLNPAEARMIKEPVSFKSIQGFEN
jgi:hypothetical protein